MLVLESRQPGREVAPEEIKWHAEPNEAGKYVVGHRGIGLVIELQHPPRVLYELAALGRQVDHPALAPCQQTLADPGFELSDLLADGRLRSADGLGRARKTHGVGDHQKRAKAIDIEIHLPVP